MIVIRRAAVMFMAMKHGGQIGGGAPVIGRLMQRNDHRSRPWQQGGSERDRGELLAPALHRSILIPDLLTYPPPEMSGSEA